MPKRRRLEKNSISIKNKFLRKKERLKWLESNLKKQKLKDLIYKNKSISLKINTNQRKTN